MSKDAKKKPKKLHMRKFMDGAMTPTEAHQKWGFNGRKCDACSQVAIVKAISMAAIAELNSTEAGQAWLLRLAKDNEGRVPVVELTYGKFVKIGEAFACTRCRPTLEKDIARKPSWVLVEFQEAPKEVIAGQVSERIGG